MMLGPMVLCATPAGKRVVLLLHESCTRCGTRNYSRGRHRECIGGRAWARRASRVPARIDDLKSCQGYMCGTSEGHWPHFRRRWLCLRAIKREALRVYRVRRGGTTDAIESVRRCQTDDPGWSSTDARNPRVLCTSGLRVGQSEGGMKRQGGRSSLLRSPARLVLAI